METPEAFEAGDGTDFRPFFDMVIGILFVLLILVTAQIYFQQTQVDTVASDAAKREATLRRADITAFLDALAARLRADGLTVTTDAENGTVLLPLRDVLGVETSGLPTVVDGSVDRLGSTLAEQIECVTAPRSARPACSAFARLDLDALDVGVGVGTLPPGAALPRDRFGDLGAAMLSAKLIGGHPSLIGASNATGGRVIRFGTRPTAPVEADLADPGLRGDLVLDFTFR